MGDYNNESEVVHFHQESYTDNCLRMYEDTVQKTIESMSKKLRKLQEDRDNQQFIERNRNIIMYNLPDTVANNEDLYESVFRILKDIVPEFIYAAILYTARIGKVRSSRPVIIKLVSPWWKKRIFQNKDKWHIHEVNFRSQKRREEFEDNDSIKIPIINKLTKPCIMNVNSRVNLPAGAIVPMHAMLYSGHISKAPGDLIAYANNGYPQAYINGYLLKNQFISEEIHSNTFQS